MKLFLIVAAVFTAATSLPTGNVEISSENPSKISNIKLNEKNLECSGEYDVNLVLTNEQKEAIFGIQIVPLTGTLDARSRWFNKQIPYVLSDAFTQTQKNDIRAALDTLESVSCLIYVVRTNQADYITVTPENDGCYATSRDGRQLINLHPGGCINKKTIMHEFMHTLGFTHMQSASERDDYIQILWENLKDGRANTQFVKHDSKSVSQFGVPYDYFSVMHYFDTAFSINGKKTMVPRQPGITLGGHDNLSNYDIARINAMYCK